MVTYLNHEFVPSAYNGSNWLTSGLSGFKPTFLGQEYWTKFAQNQQKVVNASIKENRIAQGPIDRDIAFENYFANAQSNPTLALQTLFAATTTTLNARGGVFTNKDTMTELRTRLVNSDMTTNQIEDLLSRTDDPVIKGKSFAEARPAEVRSILKGRWQQQKDLNQADWEE